MAALPFTVNTLSKSEMEYPGKFGHAIGRIQHISIMNKIGIFYIACLLGTQTVAPKLPGFQGLNR